MAFLCLFSVPRIWGSQFLPNIKGAFSITLLSEMTLSLRRFSPDISFYKQLFQKTRKPLKSRKYISEWNQDTNFLLILIFK